VLESWVNGTDPCADAWYGISCNCSDIGPFVTEVRSEGLAHPITPTHQLANLMLMLSAASLCFADLEVRKVLCR